MKGIKTFEIWNPLAQEYMDETMTEDMSKLSKAEKLIIKRQIEAGFLREIKK